MKISDKELSQWTQKTLANERWFVEPPHHVAKQEAECLKVAILSGFSYQFTMIALGGMGLYHAINRDPLCLGIADRLLVYEPLSTGMGQLYTDLQLESPLKSLEREIPLFEFDLICISLTTPDSITTALHLLALGGVPWRSDERVDGPLVLAGGPGCSNPEPFADLFDMCCIGDGEELTKSIINAVSHLRRMNMSSRAADIAKALGHPPGLYVPAMYEFTFAGNSISAITSREDAPLRISTARDNQSEQSQCTLVSDGSTAVIVPNYGCKHRCAYCQISEVAYREHSVDPLLDKVHQYVNAGVSSLIVNSATLTQHSDIGRLLEGISRITRSADSPVNVYIGSMRFDEVSPDILSVMDKIGAFSHTYLLYTNGEQKRFMALAPEHGSRELMKRLNRQVDPWRILQTVTWALQQGIANFVLYFIVGFESETISDRQMTAALLTAVLNMIDAHGGVVIMKINPLIPTPSTACQRLAMPSFENYKLFTEEICDEVKAAVGQERFSRQVEVVTLPPERLQLEGIINRADRRIGRLIERVATSRACGFSPTEEKLKEWLSDAQQSWEFLAGSRTSKEILPWAVVDRTSSVHELQVLDSIRVRLETRT